ncbi:hypothetical protein HMPREF1705_04676 [Acetomicrobium hydrogeniformans ATCC BAA-1850]|uniref:Uncharacterized protein n=1 Tax=Acetomicrobium hydrogeniformans ATCC BAA-1850 TaxID=592015 RepID=A0A0T5XBZ1_9BACT|nr:hypothetical protein HMPREF1705_04676 [Acetomicrobium hydrogeniformans ATCC BAA-1850]
MLTPLFPVPFSQLYYKIKKAVVSVPQPLGQQVLYLSLKDLCP